MARRKRRTREAGDESGVAIVEFALILPVFLVLIVGIIEFGLGLNYWLDMTHTANQGARYAVVNLNPVCAPPNGTGVAPTPCPGNTSFDTWLKAELTGNELKTGSTSVPGGGATVTYCYDNLDGIAGPTVGDPITVTVKADYDWLPFLDINTGLTKVTLVGKATMRLEQVPGRLSPATC